MAKLELIVGYGEADNQLGIANGALVRATNVVMDSSMARRQLLSVSDASLIVTTRPTRRRSMYGAHPRLDKRHGKNARCWWASTACSPAPDDYSQ